MTVANPHVTPWTLASLTSSIVVVPVTAGLVAYWPVGFPFVAAIGVVLALEIAMFRRVYARTAAQNGPQPFTIATMITVLRGAAIVLLAGFVITGQPETPFAWLPALLFAVGTLFDAVDGAVARATDTTSAFGGRLDTEIDSLALLLGSLLAVRFGAAPGYFLAVGAARYLFILGIAFRQIRGGPVHSLPPRQSRRILGAMMMLVVFILLTPVLDSKITYWLATAAMIAFVLGFMRDWLLITEQTV